MSPTNARAAASTSARVTGISVRSSTAPDASSVSVATPNTERRAVLLARLLQEPQQPGHPSEPDEQHTGRIGIERAGVADRRCP